jgi:hypothetical protein
MWMNQLNQNKMKDNKLIAEFMGIVYPKLDNVIVIDNVVIKENELQYHTSWDWLMPVVEKIAENHTFIMPFLNTSCKFEEGVLVFDEYVDKKLYKKRKINLIDAVYNQVVDTIKRYNDEKLRSIPSA